MKISAKTILKSGTALLATVALLAPMAACGSSSSDGKTEITIAFWGGNGSKEIMQKRVDAIKSQLKGIKIKLQWIPEDYDTKIQTMMSGNTAPDIMEVAEAVNAYSSRGQLEDLTPYFKKLGVDANSRFGEAAVKMYSMDGKMYAAPDRVAPNVVFYNKDMFKEAGVDENISEWDWDTLRENLKKLTKRSGNKTTQWGLAEGMWWPWYMQWIYQNGGRLVSEDGKKAEINSPQNLETFEFYQDLMWKDHTVATPQELANNGPDNLFAQGKLAMETTGFWNTGALKDAKINWGVSPLWHGKKEATALFTNALALTSQSKHKDEAAKVISLLTSKEGQKEIGTSGQDIPANVEAAADPSVEKGDWNTKGISIQAWNDARKQAFPAPTIPKWNEMNTAFADGMTNTWAGKQSVKAGLDKAQEKLERALKQN